MANERYQRNSHKWWQTWHPLRVGLPVTSERYWASFQVTRLFHKATVSQCDHFFFATYIFVVWNLTRLITRLKIFFNLDLVGEHSSAQLQYVFTICAVYWSLGRRGYFGISNVALVQWCCNVPCKYSLGRPVVSQCTLGQPVAFQCTLKQPVYTGSG